MKKMSFALCFLGMISLIACSTPHAPPNSNASPIKKGTDTQQAHKRDKRFL